ncbi:hypothetical protein BH09PSE5_BH09PSE5_39640 [soil metagenome]
MRQFVQFEDIDPYGGNAFRPLSPTRVSVAPVEVYKKTTNITTPRVSLEPKTVRVTPEQAATLQLMQGAISAARRLMPNASNQIGGLHNSKFLSNTSMNYIREATIPELQSIYESLDERTEDSSDVYRPAFLAQLMLAASHATGNCGELNVFCYYLLGSMPEMKPYKLQVLKHDKLDHQILVAHVGDKKLVCDAWPQFPMAAPSTELLPAYQDGYFSKRGNPHVEVSRTKKAGQQLAPFPVADILEASHRGQGKAYVKEVVSSAFCGTDNYVDFATEGLKDVEKGTVSSVLYTSPPGIQYAVDDGRRFNLRYLYPDAPTPKWQAPQWPEPLHG